MKRYLVQQVGCIECGVSTFPIGIYQSLEEAKKVAKDHPSTWDTEGGDGFVQIIDIKKLEVVED